MDYNVDKRVDQFIQDILLQAGNLRTDNVMFTLGSDFQYENAIEWYKNLDKLMMYTMKKVRLNEMNLSLSIIQMYCHLGQNS